MIQNKHWRFRSPRTFFGLSDKYIQSVYEQFFLLKYHGNWGFMEAYSLPVMIRKWFVERLAKQFEDEREEYEKAKKKRR